MTVAEGVGFSVEVGVGVGLGLDGVLGTLPGGSE